MTTLKTSIEAISRWMKNHGAPKLVKNLAPGASEAAIAAMEKRVGASFPKPLRELYRLHDGQREELDCFLPALNFLGLRWALNEREHFRVRYVEGRYGVLQGSIEELREDEVNERWWVLGNMDSDYLVVSLESGRVFFAMKDVPPLRLAANDVTEFFATLARRVEGGAYRVEEGFGEYYLATDEPWPAPATKKKMPEPPAKIVDDVFEETLGSNLFFLVDDVDVRKGVVEITLALHAPAEWQARLRAHRVIREPLARFEAAVTRALAGRRVTIELSPVEVDEASLRLYLKKSGALGADLLRELG